jgi:GTPase
MTNTPQDENYKAGYVAVIGRPNVGKSTFINAILGQKIAAVSHKPQTTRKQQIGILTLSDAQIVFTDTPGIHRAKHKLGKFMNAEAKVSLEETDLILWLVDGSVMPTREDEIIGDLLKGVTGTPIVIGLNKIDLIRDDALAEHQMAYQSFVSSAVCQPLSAKKRENLDPLLALIIRKIPTGYPFYPEDQLTDVYERDIAADLIREAALHMLRDEVPHSVAVRMDEYTERNETGAYIEATLFVERESQKGIIIGDKGAMIKSISTHARKEIESMSGRKVFLRLRVKVRKNWRNDESTLKLFGFKGKRG